MEVPGFGSVRDIGREDSVRYRCRRGGGNAATEAGAPVRSHLGATLARSRQSKEDALTPRALRRRRNRSVAEAI